MKTISVTLIAASLILSGCAGQKANPVQVIQPNDSKLTCNELKNEITISSTSLSRLVGERKSVETKNAVAVGVGAVVFFPALFFMNLKGSARIEAAALQERIGGLAQRHNAKGCKPKIVIQTAEEAKAAAAAKKAAE